MPALMAIIGADANPMKRELAAVQRMAQQAGVNIRRGLDGGAGHFRGAGAMREAMVITREIASGNFSKVPGSMSIFLQQIGLLKFILKDNASVATVLARAWKEQAEAASLAAIAATRKAAASTAALYAEGGETEATLAAAIADETKATAAVANARAAQLKATASAEAAAAAGAEGAATVGSIGIIAGALVGLAAGAFAAYKLTSKLKETLSGLKPGDFNLDYIPKQLKASSQTEEAAKTANKEIEKSIELYNSAAKAAERVADATKEHFEHLRKMNEFEKDPKKKAAQELEINRQERLAQLSNKHIAQANLELESQNKMNRANAIKVSSEAADKQRLDLRKKEAEEAKKFLEELDSGGGDIFTKRRMFRAFNKMSASNVSDEEILAAEARTKAEAQRRIQAYKDTANQVAENEEKRKFKQELVKGAAESAAKATTLGMEIVEQEKKDALANARDAQRLEAEAKAKMKFDTVHGSVNALQQVGAYAAPAVTIAEKQLHEIKGLRQDVKRLGSNTPTSHRGGTRY